MTEAVIVSTARTPLCKSWRGALNMTHGAKMGGHVVHAALERARVDADEVEDVIIGCANPEGATGWNIARQIAVRAGCPSSVPRSEEHTSELQSRLHLVCRLLLEKKKSRWPTSGTELCVTVHNYHYTLMDPDY